MRKIILTLLLIVIAFYSHSQTYVSTGVVNKPDLQNLGLENIAIGAYTEFKNNNTSYVKGYAMYASYSSDNSSILNSLGVVEHDEHFSDNISSLRSYLNTLESTSINQTELNGLIFGNGVFEINNSVNLTNGGSVQFTGDVNSILVLNIQGDLNIDDNTKMEIVGIRPENIFWNVSGKITIGSLVEVYGVFVSNREITNGQYIVGDRVLLSGDYIHLGELNEDIASYEHLLSLTIIHQEELANIKCNYVSNYSFEQISDCPTQAAQIYLAQGWFNAGITDYGPDLFGCTGCSKCYRTPSTTMGEQDPRTGTNYAGIYVFSNRTYPSTSNHLGYREFVGNKLLEPLQNGKTYKVEFYVSASDINKTFSSNIGVYFSNVKHSLATNNSFTHGDNPQVPQVLSTTIIKDTKNWTKIEGTFTANGTEQYLYIGNFDSDWQMNYWPVGVGGDILADDSYYFIDDVKVSELHPDLIVDAGEDKCNSALQGVQIGGSPSASGGSSSVYTYTWTPTTGLSSASIPNPIANPTTKTTYKLKVEDSEGCAEYDEVTVYVENAANGINITAIKKYDNFEDIPVEFKTDCDGCTEVLWEFGDGDSYTTNTPGEIVYHTYTKPGYYLVKTLYSHPCGVGGNRGVIYVAPNTYASLNPAGINYNTFASFTLNEFLNPYSNAEDITITSQTAPISNPLVWTNTGTRFEIKGELRIKSGASLEILNRTIRFGPAGKIVVEPGAYLKLDGCTLKGYRGNQIIQDEFMWFGVELQSEFDDNYQNYIKGHLTMINNATIQDAHVGITVGKSIVGPINATNNSEFHYNYYAKESGGGMLQVDNAKFINNGTHIRFYGGGYFNYNKSVIKNSEFTSTNWGLKDPYYYSANEDYNELKGRNPHMLGTNPNIDFPIGRSSQGIELIHMKGVEITNNTFNGINHPITLANSRAIKVKSNTFDNSPLAIYINGIFDVYSNNTIYNNSFLSLVSKCIITKGSNGDNIEGNFIRRFVFPSQTIISTEGPTIELESANFIVRDNIIKDYATAIYIKGDPFSANYGFIGNKAIGNNIEANSFMPFIRTEGNNKKLLMKCNEFTYLSTSNNSNKYVWQISDEFGNQGIPKTNSVLYPNTTPAGNIFDRISANPVRKVENSAQSNLSYYYRHRDVFCTPLPDDEFFKVLNNEVDYVDYATSCVLPVITQPEPIITHVDALRGIVNTYGSEMANVVANLDQNNTEGLISLLTNTEDWDDISNTLVDHSPLSENVLSILLATPSAISEEGFLSIMTKNLPIYDNLHALLNEVVAETFPGIVAEIEELSAYNPNVRTPKAVEIDIDKTEKEKMFYITNYLELKDQTDELENALDFLDDDYSNEITKMQFSDAYFQGDYNKANTYRSKMMINNEADQNFADYSSFLINLTSNNRTYWEMDSTEKNYLYSFAAECPQTMERKQARNLIKLVYGDTLASCNVNGGRINKTVQPQGFDAHTCFLGNGYPNPSNHTFSVPYKVNDFTNAALEIYDINGAFISKKKINTKQGILPLDVESLASGIYFYKLVVNGTQIGVKKLVKIK